MCFLIHSNQALHLQCNILWGKRTNKTPTIVFGFFCELKFWIISTLPLSPFLEDQDYGDDDGGEDDNPQQEDEGRDSGGDYEEEDAEAEQNESRQTSDSGHGDALRSSVMSEEENKPETKPEGNTNG